MLPNTSDPFDVAVAGPNGHPAQFTHWSFGQLSALAGAPAGYMRSGLPGALIADNLNWGLHHARSVEDVGVLLRKDDNGEVSLSAATGPNYGRVWDTEICDQLVDRFGDGVSGAFRVPGEFGNRVDVTKENTTIYGSDRDMWVFLADETNRVELQSSTALTAPRHKSFARGFYLSNSEVGAKTLTLGMFLFDYACCNRILWGVAERQEMSQLSRSDVAAKSIAETITAAQRAYARSIPHQDARVLVERSAGALSCC